MDKVNFMMQFNEFNEKDYIWYKLCVFYYAQTELFDRGLTDLRSPYDPTEAFIHGDSSIRGLSYANARKMRKFIIEIAVNENLSLTNIETNFEYLHYSAQRWIDEYYRLKDMGEMDFIYKYF